MLFFKRNRTTCIWAITVSRRAVSGELMAPASLNRMLNGVFADQIRIERTVSSESCFRNEEEDEW